MVSFGKLQPRVKLEVASPEVAEILLGNPNYWGAPLAQDHPHFFFRVGFYDGRWKTQAMYQI